MYTDFYKCPLHWEIIDTIVYPDGEKEVRTYHNTVVNDCSKLIACLIKAHTGFTGVKYWAVGKGEPTWNNESLPSPTVNDTSLRNETFRKIIKPEDIIFLDASNKPSTNPTNRLQIKVIFNENEANGDLREFGLFGGTASNNANSGIMINRKIHPLIYKTTGMKLERVIRLVF